MIKKKFEIEYLLIVYVLYLEFSNNFMVFTPYLVYYMYMFATQQTAKIYMLVFNYVKFMEILQTLSVLFVSNSLLKMLFYVSGAIEQLHYPLLLSFVILAICNKQNNNTPIDDDSNMEQIYNE